MIKVGLRYARLEKRLGEIDRARGIYGHISQYSDPQDDALGLWKVTRIFVQIVTLGNQEWEQFEIQHGNEDTYKEMMRIRRGVLAKFAIRPPSLKDLEESIQKANEIEQNS